MSNILSVDSSWRFDTKWHACVGNAGDNILSSFVVYGDGVITVLLFGNGI